MAATLARAVGYGNDESRECSRLGPDKSVAFVQTFKTFVISEVKADGSGFTRVEREIDGKRVPLVSVSFDGEDGHHPETTFISARKGYTGRYVVESYDEAAV